MQRAQAEARRHRWLESEKVGHDLGDAALRDWRRRHWCSFRRQRWLEHIEGRVFWDGFEEGQFGILASSDLSCAQELLEQVVERLRAGDENLDIIAWAFEAGHDVADVVDILDRLDVNAQHQTWVAF